MMRICLCGMVDRRKTLNLISSWDHCRRFPPSQILDKPTAGLERAQNLSSGFVEGSCMEIIINSLLCHNLIERYSNVNCLSMFFFKWPVWNQVLVFLLMRINNRLNEIVREINIKILFFYTLFPDILRENPLDSNEKYASEDADFIFISIPLGEAIEFLFDEIYVQK